MPTIIIENDGHPIGDLIITVRKDGSKRYNRRVDIYTEQDGAICHARTGVAIVNPITGFDISHIFDGGFFVPRMVSKPAGFAPHPFYPVYIPVGAEG